MVTSRRRIAASLHFAEMVVIRVGVAKDPGAAVMVEMGCAFVGISVAVTKFWVGTFCTSFVMEIQETRKVEIRIVKKILFTIYVLKHARTGGGISSACFIADHGLVLDGAQISDHGPACGMASSNCHSTINFPTGGGFFDVNVNVFKVLFST